MARGNNNLFVHFQRSGGDQTLGWGDLSEFDVLFIQRPYTGWNLELLQVAKDSGLKTWIDYDDDLFNIEPHNPAFKTYSNPKIKDTIKKIIDLADLLTFSTEHLKSIMGFEHPNCHIVKNATDFDLLKIHKAEKITPLENVIFWRGSKSHDDDLFKFAEPMGRIAKENPKWKFLFLGQPWFGLLNFIPAKQSVVLPPVFLPKYFSFIQTLRPAISIVPLADSVFNKSKSNIAWQEATIAGSSCIVPAWPEWNVPGAVGYLNPDTFYIHLNDLIMNPAKREDLVAESCDTLKEHFDLKQMIEMRRSLLGGLCSTLI